MHLPTVEYTLNIAWQLLRRTELWTELETELGQALAALFRQFIMQGTLTRAIKERLG